MSKQGIKEVALDLFNASGYEGASVRDITRAAGLSTSTFYAHYPSKEALYFDILEGCLAELGALLDQVMDEGSALGPEERLFAFTESRVRFFFEHHSHYTFIVRNSLFPPASLQDRVHIRIREWEEHVFKVTGGVIEAGKREGVFRDEPAEEIAKSLLRLLNGFGVQVITMGETQSDSRENLKKSWKFYMDGLRSR